MVKRQDGAFAIRNCPPPGNPSLTEFTGSLCVGKSLGGPAFLSCDPPDAESIDEHGGRKYNHFYGNCPSSYWCISKTSELDHEYTTAWCIPQLQFSKQALYYPWSRFRDQITHSPVVGPILGQRGLVIFLKYYESDDDFYANQITITPKSREDNAVGEAVTCRDCIELTYLGRPTDVFTFVVSIVADNVPNEDMIGFKVDMYEYAWS